MAIPTKTANNDFVTITTLASNSVLISSVVNVASKFAAFVGINFGRAVATALTEGVEFRLEGSMNDSTDGEWFPLAVYKTAIAAASDEAVSGTAAAGSATLAVTSVVGFAAGDLISMLNATLANSEFGRVRLVSASVITIEDNLTFTQTSSSLFDSAEFISFNVDLSAVTRMRLVTDARNTGQTVMFKAKYVLLDSIG